MPYYGKNTYYYAPQMSRINQFYKSTGTINPNIFVLNNYTQPKNTNTNTNTDKKLNETIQTEFKLIKNELSSIKKNLVDNDFHLDEAVTIVKDNILVSNAKITNVSSTCSKINNQLQLTVDNNNSIQNLNTDNLNEIKKQLIGLDKKIDLLLSKT
jgi:hypothetical protein